MNTINLKQYAIITGNYWSFTISDGALRMLVVLHFYTLGYTPLSIAMLFLFYEVFGVITNLVGGWLGAKIGLNRTMNIGLALQIIALSMLLVPTSWLTVPWVMCAQALSGIAKDLNKMSAKSAIKLFVNNDQENSLYRWVSFLTGSKNTLKGVGFFLGSVLLSWLGFWFTVVVLCVLLCSAWLISLVFLKAELGISKQKAKFTDIFSKSPAINCLSAARLFLFAARDVWFVVALPVYLALELGWSHGQVGSFLAAWIIGYGFVQTITPAITGKHSPYHHQRQALVWALLLAVVPALIATTMHTPGHAQTILIAGLLLFGGVFAVNSALHSYLIVSFADRDGVSLDVGFYYMANAMGRLCGTVLSGWLFQRYGLAACLWVASALTLASAGFALLLPYNTKKTRL